MGKTHNKFINMECRGRCGKKAPMTWGRSWICPDCLAISWKVLYLREEGIGSIPANLLQQ